MSDVRVTQWPDVESILSDLSPQNAVEYETLGWGPDEIKMGLVKFLAAGESRTLFVDGTPQCMLALREHDGAHVTWFLARKAFFDKYSASVLRFSRNYMAAAAAKHGPILSFSASDDPLVERWFKALGFEFAGYAEGAKIFLYEPRRA